MLRRLGHGAAWAQVAAGRFLSRSAATRIVQPCNSAGHQWIAGRLASTVAAEKRREPMLTHAMPDSGGTLRVAWDDSVAGRFHYVWLRDNCRCPRCNDVEKDQRLFSTATIPLDTQPSMVAVSKQGDVNVRWQDGDHMSTYPSSWLRDHAEPFLTEGHSSYTSPKAKPPNDAPLNLNNALPKPVLWTESHPSQRNMFVEYADLTSSDPETAQRCFLELSNNVLQHGMTIMRGVPTDDSFGVRVADMVGIHKRIPFGDRNRFEVVYQENAVHRAYTKEELYLHTDDNEKEMSPGILFLLCLKLKFLKNTSEEEARRHGRSTFADGFAVADYLRKNDPAAFAILTSTPVTFVMLYNKVTYTHLVPIICLDHDGEVKEIHMSNHGMAPLQLPPDQILPFYKAHRSFTDCIGRQEFHYSLQLQAGEMAISNNRRMLHGRTAWDPEVLERKLQVCFSDLDDFHSRYREALRGEFKL